MANNWFACMCIYTHRQTIVANQSVRFNILKPTYSRLKINTCQY